MSTTYEAHLTIGCYVDDADDMDMEEEHFREFLYDEHNIIWYEEDDFYGYTIGEITTLNINTIQDLGKTARKIEKALGTKVTVKACLYKY